MSPNIIQHGYTPEDISKLGIYDGFKISSLNQC